MDSIKQAFLLFLMTLSCCLLCALTSVAQASENKRCFPNAQLAYDYLLTQEKQQSLNAQSFSNKSANLYASNSYALNPSKININTASEAELVTLAGIGSKKAQAIVVYRNTMGQFNSVDELEKVHGIGEKTVDKNRARLKVAD